jgi:hypothetical protein
VDSSTRKCEVSCVGTVSTSSGYATSGRTVNSYTGSGVTASVAAGRAYSAVFDAREVIVTRR